MATFRFSLQAKLDQAVHRRDQATDLLLEVQAACERERELLQQLDRRISDRCEALDRLQKTLSRPRETTLPRPDLARTALDRNRTSSEIEGLVHDRAKVASGLQVLSDLAAIRSASLASLRVEVEVLERLRTRHQKAAQDMQQRREDGENEEAASQLWIRQSRSEPPHGNPN